MHDGHGELVGFAYYEIMLVTRLWLRDRSSKLQLCSQAALPLLFEESSPVSLRREDPSSSVGFGLQGKHGFLRGTSVCSFVETGLGSACYASTRRWTCAWVLDSNANCRGDGLLSNEEEIESFQKDLCMDTSVSEVDEASISDDDDDDAATFVSVHVKAPAGKDMEDTFVIQKADSLGSQTVERLDDKQTAIDELLKLLERQGWTESTRALLMEKHSHRELSFSIVSKVMVRLKDVALVSSLFEWVCEHLGHDASIYHPYLKALAQAKHFNKMWGLLTKMKDNGIEVNFVAFCFMIKACGHVGNPAMAVKVFKSAPDYGVELNIELYRSLLSTLFLLNLAADARLLYSSMVQQGLSFDIHTFNSLIHGFGMTSGVEDVKKSVDVMLKEGIRPDLSSYNALVSAYCNVHAIDSAMSVLYELKESGLTTSAGTLNIIIEAMCNKGKFDDAIDLLASVRSWCLPRMSTFNILFDAMLWHKQASKAISFFQVMEEEGLTNQWTYIKLSSGLRQCVQTKKIQDFLKGLHAKYGYSKAGVCHALLHNLTSLGQVDEAESLFRGIVDAEGSPSLTVYGTMIGFYCNMKMPDRALQILLDLKDKGLKPNVFCYNPVIGGLLNASQVAEARKCYQEMLDCGLESNESICNHLLRELCRHNMLSEVPEILSTMMRKSFTMQGSTFFQLAKCMCKAGKIKETNTLLITLHELRCLCLSDKGVVQALSVVKLMPAI